ncbi:hypothetical protein [Plebeiibacterium sediminum]|uniref:Uncharacterized protein n=1 Tax=Plebeiibacterium sediminum TaxID=2992112 RepID=A0AAE3SGW9_9BACT|nr:hypothetical protein [Plebeiobacterium sediminum]MCW3788923.1 hypothetical protein [Plebeiobacterium sediminum]
MITKRSLKEWFVWYWPSRRTVIGWTFISLIFCLLVLLIHGNPFEQSLNKKRFKGIADNVEIISIDRKEYLSQDETGNKIRTLGYSVKYTYHVKGKLYFGTNFLNKSNIHSKKLDNILQGDYEVRYMLAKPDHSIIIQK